jgi:hypothetical protein
MPPNIVRSISTLIQQRQREISILAAEAFEKTWSEPYTHKSDQQWLNALRLDHHRSTFPITESDWAKFLTDYIVVRWFDPERRALISDCICMQSELDLTDSHGLAKLWQEKKITSKLQVSVASKALFFLVPQVDASSLTD